MSHLFVYEIIETKPVVVDFRSHFKAEFSGLFRLFLNTLPNLEYCARSFKAINTKPKITMHTWRRRHIYEESKIASSTRQKLRIVLQITGFWAF